MLLAGNIEDERGPLHYLYVLFAVVCFYFYFPVSPVLKHPCVLLTHPSLASTQPLVTGDICIFNGNYADCWGWAGAGLGWAGLPPDLLQTEHPEHAATVTRAYSHIAHSYKNFRPGLKLRESCRSRSRSTEIRWFVM